MLGLAQKIALCVDRVDISVERILKHSEKSIFNCADKIPYLVLNKKKHFNFLFCLLFLIHFYNEKIDILKDIRLLKNI